jgi:putative tryptophan/tyrosine transport system substrate-binding protein
MRRREFLSVLAGAAAWPLAARAQQPGQPRRIGVLMGMGEAQGESWFAAFQEGLKQLGWNDGSNVRIDIRWGRGQHERLRGHAVELVSLKPDIMFAGATSALVPLKQATQTIPIVFAQVSDPLRGGFVANLAHPSDNVTGFALYEYTIVVKWLELLKQLAPAVTRVAALYDPTNPTNLGQLPELERRAATFGMRSFAFPVRNAAEIEHAIDEFAKEANSGILNLGNPVTQVHRDVIVRRAAKHHLPSITPYREDVKEEGFLASYGVDVPDLYRRAASYVDRILKGEKPGELPVQFATKFELVINLKTAAALGLDIPVSLLARTDEVIE